jgi:peptidoglycan/xylan/chitin deacetylase (PgdA/CDA1 family)
MTTSPARLARRLGFAAALVVLAMASTSPDTRAGEPRAVSTPVPILMYHVIADSPAGAPYPELFVSEADFAAQMNWLARHGYQAVTQRDVWNHWHRGGALPAKPIVISFDDGYRGVAHAALPEMHRRSWPGVLNLAVKNLHVSGGLSERQVRRLIAAGWELASHSLTHPNLPGLDDLTLRREVTRSRAVLRVLFRVPVDFFCYPAGRYDPRVVRAVRRAGYLGATTTVDGLARPEQPYELRRVRVSGSDGESGLARKLVALSAS